MKPVEEMIKRKRPRGKKKFLLRANRQKKPNNFFFLKVEEGPCPIPSPPPFVPDHSSSRDLFVISKIILKKKNIHL
jgi:hypothetical protein